MVFDDGLTAQDPAPVKLDFVPFSLLLVVEMSCYS